MIKDYSNIDSIITETYEIRKEQRGMLFAKTVEVEKPTRKKKEIYKNGILVSYEEVYENYRGEKIRKLGEITTLPNGESEEKMKEYIISSNKLINEETTRKDKYGYSYSTIYHNHESYLDSISSWKHENVYDSMGRLVHRKNFYKNKLCYTSDYYYDGMGNCTKKSTQYFEEGQNYKEEIECNSYDFRGNCIREETITHYKLQLKYLEGKDGKSVRVWKRNEHGDVIHTEWNRDGNVSYYSHDLKYDSHNNCIEDRTHITGAASSRPDSLCRYIITYK